MEIIKKDEIKRILEKYNIDITINEIEKRYSEEHRHYHTLEHINFLIEKIYEKYKNGNLTENDKDILIVAAIFHDIIYEIDKPDNEEQSAELLQNRTKFIDEFQQNDIQKIYNIIIDTKDHNTEDRLSMIFCDLDMYSISNSTFAELLKYERQIYLEYQKFGFSTYKKYRVKFLHNMLSNKYGIKNRDNILKLIEYIENYTPKVGIYAGSFNPFHIGHKDIINKSESLFDKVIIAVGINPEKDNDIEYIKELKDNTNLLNEKLNKEVCFFSGLLTDFIKEKIQSEGIDITLIKGIRDGSDIIYENKQIQYMKDIYPELKVVFIPGDRKFNHISSSNLKFLKSYGENLIDKYLA